MLLSRRHGNRPVVDKPKTAPKVEPKKESKTKEKPVKEGE